MKKLGKIKLANWDILDTSEMKQICGGGDTIRCCCGMGKDIECIDLPYATYEAGLGMMSDHCPYGIGGCF